MLLDFFNVHISLRQIIEKIKRKINFQTANKIKEFHLMIETNHTHIGNDFENMTTY